MGPAKQTAGFSQVLRGGPRAIGAGCWRATGPVDDGTTGRAARVSPASVAGAAAGSAVRLVELQSAQCRPALASSVAGGVPASAQRAAATRCRMEASEAGCGTTAMADCQNPNRTHAQMYWRPHWRSQGSRALIGEHVFIVARV